LFDRDLDPPRRPLGDLPPSRVARYQRLVVNPFLSVLMLVLALAGAVFSVRWGSLPGVWLSFSVLCGAFFSVQYHCLDCGQTGWYRGSRRHVCAAVQDRWTEGRTAGWFPSPAAQLWLWTIAILALMVAFWARISSG
jgi:hypothetical protein